jgi:hypothetical protein
MEITMSYINDLTRFHDANAKLPKNQLCLVWRHACWFVAIENDQGGMMFPVKPTAKTEIRFYKENWGYETGRKIFTKRQGGKEAAMKWMLEKSNDIS